MLAEGRVDGGGEWAEDAAAKQILYVNTNTEVLSKGFK
jgi:hypothetical protein